jgi:hypothetical protein
MKAPLAPLCAVFASLCLFVSLAGSQTSDTPRAWIDPTGPDWRSLTLDDFDNVNGEKDTWTATGNDIHSTGVPVGVARSKKQYTNFEMVAEWRHLKSAGNSGIFVWAPEEAFKDLKPGKLPRGGIEVQILDHGFREQYEKRSKKKGDWFTTQGDIFPVLPSKFKPFAPTSPDGKRSFPRKNLTKGTPEWNHYYIRAINGEIRLWINGEEVSGGNNAEPRSGYLCLEAEGSPIDFRNLRIRELP